MPLEQAIVNIISNAAVCIHVCMYACIKSSIFSPEDPCRVSVRRCHRSKNLASRLPEHIFAESIPAGNRPTAETLAKQTGNVARRGHRIELILLLLTKRVHFKSSWSDSDMLSHAPDSWSTSGCTLSLEMMRGLVEAMIQCDGRNVAFMSREERFSMVSTSPSVNTLKGSEIVSGVVGGQICS